MDAEAAHERTFALARRLQRPLAPVLRRLYPMPDDPRLAVEVFGRRLANPVGIAAGLDKNARLLPTWAAIGCGWAEVGSATARPSSGNPRPRLWRLPEAGALVNRMGLNNDGAAAIGARLARPHPPGLVVAVNVAKTHDPAILGDAALDDFRASFAAVAPHAAWVTLNVSCPNTREGTTFEAPDALDALLAVVMAERARVAPLVPVLVKLAPPPDGPLDAPLPGHIDEAVAVCRARGVDGFVAGNTAPDRDGVSPEVAARAGAGGLSGAPLAHRRRRLVRHLFRATNGAVPIVATGGIASAADAWTAITDGASLVGLYTGLVYRGPGLVGAIGRGLIEQVERTGAASIGTVVGLAV